MGKVELKLEIDPDLLARARKAGVEPSEVLETELRRRFGQRGVEDRGRAWSAETLQQDAPEVRAAKWAEENLEAIEDHRRRMEEHGVFGEDLRRW